MGEVQRAGGLVSPVTMGKVIVADENQVRTLLASTLEREGFDVTRAGTLRQAEGTALLYARGGSA